MLEIPIPAPGKFTVPLDDKRGNTIFVETTWDGVMELVAVYRAQGHTTGTVPVANDRGEIIEVELSQH
jgi:hypothetical protein